MQNYRNINKLLADKKLIRKSFIGTHECPELYEKRGPFQTNIQKYQHSKCQCGY
jgi:hypothetical protein